MSADLTAAVQDLRKKLRLLTDRVNETVAVDISGIIHDIDIIQEQITQLEAKDVIGSTEKITGTHAGKFGEQSITDDYFYMCVTEGDSATAIWKKVLLFQSI